MVRMVEEPEQQGVVQMFVEGLLQPEEGQMFVEELPQPEVGQLVVQLLLAGE